MKKSLVGNIYGDIKAIEYLGNKKYKCQCIKCGHISEKFSSNLKGNITCTQCNRGFIVDLRNKTYGSLTVIDYNKQSKKWICRCNKCGTIIEVRSNNLKSGNTSTCGSCGRSEAVQRDIVNGTRVCMLNKSVGSNNTSGYTGVFFNKRKNKWCATITFQGKDYWLGYYFDKGDAIKARQMAEEKLYGDFIEWYNSTHENKISKK